MTLKQRAQPEGSGVYARIKRMILDNDLPSGSMFLQEELSLKLGVSRTPIREAIVRLEGEGLVEIVPRRGVRIRPVSVADMREIYEVLTALEAEAARLAATRGVADAHLDQMSEAVALMDDALACDNLLAWAEADEMFHRLLAEAAGNARLTAMISMMSDQAHRLRRMTLTLRDRPTRSNEDHRNLIAALKARDPTQAYEIHALHRSTSGQMLLALLTRLNLSG